MEKKELQIDSRAMKELPTKKRSLEQFREENGDDFDVKDRKKLKMVEVTANIHSRLLEDNGNEAQQAQGIEFTAKPHSAKMTVEEYEEMK